VFYSLRSPSLISVTQVLRRALPVLCLIFCCAAPQARPFDEALFIEAEAELKTGVGPRYEALRAELDDYPLAIYLDYQALSRQLHSLEPDVAQSYLHRAQGSPLHNRFLAAYIESKGRSRQWRDLLAVQQTPPRSPELQCYWYRAQWGTGNKTLAYEGAAQLWDVGRSQEKACDPLFKEWLKAAGPDDAMVWSRALKAFDARSFGLLKYLRQFASPSLQPLLDEMLAIYHRPDHLIHDAHSPSVLHAELMTMGIRRLARVNPEQGRQAMVNAVPVQSFTDAQRRAMASMIARHSLFAQSATPDSWLHAALDELRDDELTEIHMRNHIADGNWAGLLEGYQWLSSPAQEEDEWRYWYGRALEGTDQKAASEAVFSTLAESRSYHGFLAAQRLNADYSLAAAPAGQAEVAIPPGAQGKAVKPMPVSEPDPGIARVAALWSLERLTDARAEWRDLLARVSPDEGETLAELALSTGWINLAVDAANEVGAWDRVDLRFPSAYRENLDYAASAAGVPSAELIAIARRESALFPEAISRVGARGLMQVMPATARGLARRHDIPYRRKADLYDVDINLLLGARYYAELLARFDGNRPMSLAGYNAGPNRVGRWAKGDREVDRWIDSLPFRETREYVRAVLAYRVIYQTLNGADSQLFSQQEWQHRY